MKLHGTAAISDLLGDFVAYRGLRPVDARLPGLGDLAGTLGIPAALPPRKGDEAYARVVAEILRAARAIDAPGAPLRRMVLVGDTRLSDGGAFETIRSATGWESRAFIGADALAEAPTTRAEGDVTYANRWSALPAFVRSLETDGLSIDAGTVVVLDLDKTLIGARGRNDRLIDQARLTALRASVADALGSHFDEAAFQQTYATINQSRYHPFTGDNQDYVGYICLVVGGEVLKLAELIELLESGGLSRFDELVRMVGNRTVWPSAGVAALHGQIAGLVAAGDPTPFKAFRRREFLETVARMGCRLDDTPPEQLLREELVLTAEVWEAAKGWRARGALLFGLSDKPDEAALPAPGSGIPPLHRIPTHMVGEKGVRSA